jgi:hypothetical protein
MATVTGFGQLIAAPSRRRRHKVSAGPKPFWTAIPTWPRWPTPGHVGHLGSPRPCFLRVCETCERPSSRRRLRRSLRALDRLSQRSVISLFATSLCTGDSGDHRRNDRLSIAVTHPGARNSRRLTTREDQDGHLRFLMAIFNSAGSTTSRIGKANLATLHRFFPILQMPDSGIS